MGYADQAIIGQRAIDFVSPDHRDIVIGKYRSNVENCPYEVTLLHREGYDIPVELISRNIEFDGELLRMTLVRDIRARRAAERRMRELAERDGLTGLYNRRVLLEQLPTRIAGLTESEQTAALLFIDLDRFKQVNDRHGHAQGDRLLKAVGRELLSFLTPGDIAGRMGGDEFAMLLTGVQPEATLHRAQALLARLQAAFEATGLPDLAYASIGVALFPNHGQTADTLLRKADQAMYLAKAQGGNAVRLYAPAG
jgi:diguanylate cyclase (GGDEF)-like protein